MQASAGSGTLGKPMIARVLEVAWVFLKLGTIAFGGPAAHVAMMEAEIVKRRAWVTHARFLDLFGAASLLPGPSSSELAVYLGYERAGVLGLLTAATCFVLPAASIVTAMAWAYARYGELPATAGVLYGIKPVVIAVVAQALWTLAPKAIRSKSLAALSAIACVAIAFGVDPGLVLVGAGVLGLSARAWRGGALFAVSPPSLAAVFLTFAKIGATVFGSGYVLLAFLRDDLVAKLHWITERQLLDAIAVGQVTPGPVFTTATFIGYLVAGGRGAFVATVGIFLPGFILVGLTRPLVAKARGSKAASAFLDGVNVAALMLMLLVTAQLAQRALTDVTTFVIALVSGLLLVRYKVNATWLVFGGALVGVVARKIILG